MTYHELYLLFLYHFNYSRDYYECHDVLEELWLETQRDRFYQGLLQVAVGLYHHRWNNRKGSTLLFEGAIEKLDPYPEAFRGIDLGKIRVEAKTYLSQLYNAEQKPFEFYPLTIRIIDEELERMVESIHQEVQQHMNKC